MEEYEESKEVRFASSSPIKKVNPWKWILVWSPSHLCTYEEWKDPCLHEYHSVSYRSLLKTPRSHLPCSTSFNSLSSIASRVWRDYLSPTDRVGLYIAGSKWNPPIPSLTSLLLPKSVPSRDMSIQWMKHFQNMWKREYGSIPNEIRHCIVTLTILEDPLYTHQFILLILLFSHRPTYYMVTSLTPRWKQWEPTFYFWIMKFLHGASYQWHPSDQQIFKNSYSFEEQEKIVEKAYHHQITNMKQEQTQRLIPHQLFTKTLIHLPIPSLYPQSPFELVTKLQQYMRKKQT